MGRLAGAAFLPLVAVLACGAPPPESRPPGLPEPASDPDGELTGEGLEARALLLLMSDRRQFDPFSVQVVRGGHPELWPELAVALGRIGDPRGRAILESLILDDRAEVRRRAVFALGLLGDREAEPALAAAVFDPDRETGRRAVAALARLGTPLVAVVEAALELPPEERWPRLLPELFRFEAPEVLALGREALSLATVDEQVWAIFALGRKPLPEGRELLRLGLLHPDPWARGWAARGLGSVGDRSDIDRLRLLLEDPEPGPVIRALGAAAQLIGEGVGAAPEEWVPILRLLFDDERAGVRLTAIEVAARWLLEPRLGDELAERARLGKGRERQLALAALASARDPRAEDLIALTAASPEVELRAAAASAAASLGLESLLARLSGDLAPAVRLAVLAARLDGSSPAAEADARRALLDEDPAVRAAGIEWLAENPLAPMEEIALAIQGEESRRLVELRLDGVAALSARARAEALERGAIVAFLEVMARDEEYLVRRAAADALEELDRPRPVPEPVDSGWGLARYRELARITGRGPGRRVRVETSRGSLILELDCPSAPLTCRSFLQLVNQGFYDGLAFHRVVPDFVVQAGDPRGDGWGGPGYSLRDEPNLWRYERGVIGMARSAPDSAGSQFFITLAPQPHLNGGYTAFGRVVAGDEVLDRILQGDLIVGMTEVASDG